MQRQAAEQQDKRRNQAKKKKRVDRTGMPELFPIETLYSGPLSMAQHQDEFDRAVIYFHQLISTVKTISYDDLLADMLERFVITRKDVNDILRQAKKKSTISFPNINANEQIPKIGKGHQISTI